MSALTQPIRDALAVGRYTYASERDLQAGIAAALTRAGLGFAAEVTCVGGRIDFVVQVGQDAIGVEVKVRGSADRLRRQIEGYSADGRFAGFLIVTTHHTHRAVCGFVGGKPIDVFTIGGLA